MINLTASQIGNIGEIAIIKKFTEVGALPYRPTGDGYPTDLMVLWNGKPYKIQIKTAERTNPHDPTLITWYLERGSGSNSRAKTFYTADQVDLFALYCIETEDICLVPFEELQSKTELNVRRDCYKGVRTSKMHFISDYTFEKYFNSK